MMRWRTQYAVLWLALTGSPCVMLADVPPTKVEVVALQCDSLHEPLGIDDPRPVFSWQMRSARQGARQMAYSIAVASRTELLASAPDVWQSGKVTQSRSVGIAYAGPALEPMRRYAWKVTVWDEQGVASSSEASWWETGLMKPASWHAQWIANDPSDAQADRAADPLWIGVAKDSPQGVEARAKDTYLRSHLAVNGKPTQATLYVTGKDNFAFWLNGQSVHALDGPTSFGPLYPWGTFKVFDVTDRMRGGDNVLAAEVREERSDAAPRALLALLVVRLADGSVQRYRTGTDWKAAQEASGDWTASSFDDASWKQAVVLGHIGPQPFGTPWPPQPVSLLRKTMSVKPGLRRARLYATALGAYVPWMNDARVGDEVLAPGWTDYRDRVDYQTYDVTAQLRQGENTLGFLLADGWYASGMVHGQQRFNFGDPPLRVMAQLVLEYGDGSRQTVVTDGSWQAADSDIVRSDIYNGEAVDARLGVEGFGRHAPGAAQWWPATLAPAPRTTLISGQQYPPIRVERTLHPVSVRALGPGEFLVDMGQNLVGVERMRVRGPAGTKVALQFGEVLDEHGHFYNANMRTAAEEDSYTLRGRGDEVFEPMFTFHGFRYVHVTGYPGTLRPEDMEGVVFHTDAPLTLKFASSDRTLDQLMRNILWGQRGNFLSVPTDCPQRDERLGWMGDAQVFWRTAAYNMDLDAFSQKFDADIRKAQGPDGEFSDISPRVGNTAGQGSPGWADAGIVIPWVAYSQYGDVRVLEQAWPSMERWMTYLEGRYPAFYADRKAYGDWLAAGGPTPNDLIATAFWAYDAEMMASIAEVLGKQERANHFRDVHSKLAAAFQEHFVRPDGTVGNGSQTGYVLALRFDLLPEVLRAQAGTRLAESIRANGNHLSTGFLGTPYLLPVLSATGHAQTGFDLLHQTTYPSWGYMVDHGATTMWERWNGDQMLGDAGMNSFNHYAYGSVGEWVVRYLAGIDSDSKDPGFHHILLHPEFDPKIGSLSATYESAYGPITSGWRTTSGGVSWHIQIPANTTADVALNATPEHVRSAADHRELPLCDRPAAGAGTVHCALLAGEYEFEFGALTLRP